MGISIWNFYQPRSIILMDLGSLHLLVVYFTEEIRKDDETKVEGLTPFKTLLAILEPLLAILNFAGGASFKAGDQVPLALLGWYSF